VVTTNGWASIGPDVGVGERTETRDAHFQMRGARYSMDRFYRALERSRRTSQPDLKDAMQRIATRLFGLLICAVFTGGVISACATDSSTAVKADAGVRRDAGTKCNPLYCHYTPPAAPCCVDDTTCGVNINNAGCVPSKKDSGAQ
jgi:hypothetical protein